MRSARRMRGYRLTTRRPPRVVPFFLSTLAHASLIALLASNVRWLPGGPAGFSDGRMRDFGTIVELGGNGPGDGPQGQGPGDPTEDAPAGDEIAVTVASNNQLAPTQATSDTPPAAVVLPTADTAPVNGVGVSQASGTTVSGPRGPVKSQGGGYPGSKGTGGNGGGSGGHGGGGGTGTPGAAFMGARDEGMKVIFVIDASGSMLSHDAMQVAKAALMSSLQALDERQQFLIIFYDDKPQVIRLRSDETKPTMSVASDHNKTLARQQISGIQPGAGTDHLPPLMMALQLNPDVIFFLTDALEPPLWPKDLDKIKKLNGGRVRIHSIEFGQGPELGSDADLGNFLKKLANQNGGTYRYHDVTRFKSR